MRAARVVLAWAVAAITLASSVTGLWHVAHDVAKMGELGAAAIVAGFDVTAIIAGMRVVEDARRWSAWGLLAAVAAASAAAQIVAAPVELEWWRLLHGASPVIAIWTLHGAVGETPRHDAGTAKSDKKADNKTNNRGGRKGAAPTTPKPTGDVAAAGSRSATAPTGGARAGDVGHVTPVTDITTRRTGGRPAPPQASPPSDAQQARAVADHLARQQVNASRASRRQWEAACKEVLGLGPRPAARLRDALTDLPPAAEKGS